MDRRRFLDTFRERLEGVIRDSGLTRAGFARSVGMDRSTLSQILSEQNDRLPRIETIAAIAEARQVSIDWLLGLSQAGPIGADIMREQASIERDALSPTDERLIRWHAEAAGYKIRHVPATLPDILKSPDVIRYELERSAATRPEHRIETAAVGLEQQRRPETDMECCNSIQALGGFVRGEGIWRDLDPLVRRRQVDAMIRLVDELYPTFRWFLYDGRQRYAAPITIFGPKRAAIYIGQMYFVVNSTELIRALAENFDMLIRGAVVQPPDVPRYLEGLVREARR